ncbi:hypothetical protein [Erythrobacter sp. MTPC3]|uniref:hypothetical protein n=1 Tax=Erythrobacter sp. MTPC3 TaxID=3056564 RepID=UPI0036F26D1D
MSGIDPELNLDGFTMASYHLERGCRNFIEVARLLALDLDCDMERLRPYLRAWFNGARDAMEDAGYDMTGASTADEVAAAMKCWNLWALADKS